jgi:FecR protein
MKSLLRYPAAFVAFLGMTLLQIPVARAQDTDSVRVVRLSRAEGQVLVSHPGSDAWEEAPVNLPLQEGDSLATQGGLAEIEFENGATAYLAENSVLLITELGFAEGGRATELSLTQGTGTFYANLTRQDSFRVKASTFDVVIPDRAEFRVDAFHDGAAVEVFLGNVSVSTTKSSATLTKGQSVAVHDRDFQDLNNFGSLPEEDAFDEWVTEQGEIIRSGNKNTLAYINSPNYYGLSDLAIYGSWVNIPSFGLSWRPFSVGFSWTPYGNGNWTLDPRLGWIWVSNEAWGWMPYHFGAWLLSPTLGWVWVPGGPAGLRHWEPACVNWVHVGNQVGWVARSPLDRNGAPANLLTGVVTRPARSPRNTNEGNEIVTGKELQSATVLKGPPREFESRVAPGTQRSGISSTVGRVPQPVIENQSIVFDRGTHTFINREDSGPDDRRHPAVPPAGLIPQTAAAGAIPRMTIPSTMPAQAPPNRVLLPPPYPTIPSMNRVGAANGSQRTQTPANAPRTPQNSAGVAPRPTVAPPAPPTAPPQPSAPHNPPPAQPRQSGSAPHTAVPGQQ